MSDNIDYDELDRAIAETHKQTTAKAKAASKTPKAAPASKAAPAPKAAAIPIKRTQPLQIQQPTSNLAQNFPPRRRVYMDFIGRPHRSKNTGVDAVRLKNAELAASNTNVAPKKVAHFAAATPGMPSYRVANSHQPARSQSAPAPVIRKAEPVRPISAMPIYHKASPVAQPTPKPAARQAEPVAARPVITRAAAKPTPVAQPAPKAAPSATAVAASHAVETIKQGPTAPNANNYSLGVNSPYLRSNAPVQKRPLGDVSDFVQDDKIEKNEYPAPKKASSKKKARSKHTVKKTQKSNSNWYWPILVVLIVAAGGGLGYLLWWILQAAN